MLKLPSWIAQGVRRASRGLMGHLSLALFGALLAGGSVAHAQTSIQLTSSLYTVNEHDGFIRVGVRRFGDLKTTSDVRVVAAEGTAISGQEFVARSGNLTFGTNVAELFFDVVILDNDLTNSTKVFNITLSNPVNASLGFPSAAQVEILDDETGVVGRETGTFQFTAGAYTVTDYEGHVRAENAQSIPGARITVTRAGGNRGRVMVDYSTGGGSALAGAMYEPTSGTLIFDDYQMSQDIVVPIYQYTNFFSDFLCNSVCYQTNTTNGGFDFLCTNGFLTNFFGQFCTNSYFWTNFGSSTVDSSSGGFFGFIPYFFSLNGGGRFGGFGVSPTFDVNLQLSNPRLDPNEDTTLPQPSLGFRSTTRLGIVIVDSLQDSDGNPDPYGLGMGFERAHYRTAEDGNYQMWVNRDFTVDSCTVRYVVNTADFVPIGGNHEARTWDLEPGSDYATPFADYLPPGTFEWRLATGVPPDQATTAEDAMVTWGITEIKPKPITVPIIPDDLVEFNEDMLVQLFQRDSDQGRIQPAPLFPFDTVPRNAHLTIKFDNWRFINDDNIFHLRFNTNGVFGAEQPAGAVDRRYNLDGYADTEPPFNSTPGANGSVLALAAQADGRLVLGGEFKALNTTPSRYVGRMTRDGQIDPTFQVGSGADGPVTAVELQADGKAIIGGLFTAYQGVLRNGLARLNADGTLDSSFNPGLGAQGGPVRAMKLLSDGKLLVGGEFTSFNGTNRNYLARLNANGSLDTSFDTGTGPDDFVYAIDVYGKPEIFEQNSLEIGQRRERSDTYDTGSNEGTILLDFDFGASSDDLRVYYNNTLIYTAPVGSVGQGAATINYGPGPVKATELTVRINEGNPGVHDTVANWQYRLTVLPRTEDRPVIGGQFTSYNGVNRGRVARVNNDGTLDTTFNPGLAIESGVVYAVTKHASKVIIGGAFSEVDRVSRNNIAQLHSNGNVDLSYDPGTGFNDIVNSLALQASGKVVAGGRFTEFNTSRRVSLARLNWDGKLDTGFMDTAYNQFAGLPNPYTWMPQNIISAIAPLRVTNIYSTTLTFTNADNTPTNITFTFNRYEDQLFIGGTFQRVGGGFLRDEMLPRQNFARIWGGYTPGPGTVSFPRSTYSADENSGAVFITVNRDNGDLMPLISDFSTSDLEQGPGIATESVDYFFAQRPVIWPTARSVGNFSRRLSEAYRGNNNDLYQVTDQNLRAGGPGTNSVAPQLFSSVLVPIKDDNIQDGDEQLQLNLTVRPTIMQLGGEPIPSWPALGQSKATLTIVDNDVSPGVIGFALAQYFVDENAKKAQILLTRTNGTAGTVNVNYHTLSGTKGGTATPGSTAQTPGADFIQIPSKTAKFNSGQTNLVIEVDIIDDNSAELDETVKLELINADGGATIGLSTATLTIIDNDFAAGRIAFALGTNTVVEGESSNIVVTVKRLGGSTGSSQVSISTTDITAINGLDYIGLTNFIVRWNSGDTADRQVTIPILNRNLVDGERTFKITLSNPIVNSAAEPNALGNQKESIVKIQDDDAYGNFRFSQPSYTVDENGTNAVVTIVRVAGISGAASVAFEATADLAVPGVDFKPVSSTNFIVFTNGQTSATFEVAILDDSVVDGNKTVNLRLLSQTNNVDGVPFAGVLGVPSSAMLTIVDNELENIPAGTLDSTFNAEGADDFIHTVAQQPDGRLLIGGDFTAVNAVLRNRLARLNTDGSLDASFFAGDGPDGTVRTMAVEEDGRILIGGAFTSVSGTNRNYIARLLKGGALDQTFDPGAGANNPIYALIIQSDGKVVIGGDFSAYGPTPRNGLARLNSNGTLDTSLNPGSGGSGRFGLTVYAVAQQLDGKLLVGGDFETFNNLPANRLVRLNVDGSVDTSFDTSIGANGSVRSIAVQNDGRILVGGIFSHLQGSVKFGFTNAIVFGQTNSLPSASGSKTNEILVGSNPLFDAGIINLSYTFTNEHRLEIQAGNVSILTTNVQSFGTLAVGYPSTPSGIVRVIVRDSSNPSAPVGGKWSYAGSISGKGAGNTNSFAIPAESGYDAGLVTVNYDFTNKHSVRVVLDSTAGSTNIAYVSNLVASGQLEAKYFATNRGSIRVIVEDQAGREVSTNAGGFYSIAGTLSRGAAGIGRLNADGSVDTTFNSNGLVEVTQVSATSPYLQTRPLNPSRRGANGPVNAIRIQTDGKIVLGGDFTQFNGVTRRGVTRLNYDGLNDSTINFGSGAVGSVAAVLVQPDRKIVLAGGFTSFNGQARQRLVRINGGSIVGSGRFEFDRSLYTVSESQTNSLAITVRRTGGTTGAVLMDFVTRQDPTATPTNSAIGRLQINIEGVEADYQTTERLTANKNALLFPEGETEITFIVPIEDDELVENVEYFEVALIDPPGEPTRLGDQPISRVAISSDDSAIFFSSPAYSIGESVPSGVANIVIRREGSTSSSVSVTLATRNLTATNGLDYVGFTNRISFAPGEVERTIAIPIISDTIVEGNEFIGLTLSNPSAGGQLRDGGANATLMIVDDDFSPGQIEFAATVYSVSEGPNAVGLIRVSRVNGSFGTATIQYQTRAITATPGSDYLETSGVLTFEGETEKFIQIPIVNDDTAEGNETLEIRLSNPTGGATLGVDVATLTIVDDDLSPGSIDTAFNPGIGANAPIRAIELVGRKFVLGGDFTGYNGDTNQSRIARILEVGLADPDFVQTTNHPNNSVASLALQADKKLLIGGSFFSVGTQPARRVARLQQTNDPSGMIGEVKLDPSFSLPLGLDGQVSTLAVQADGKVLIGGGFTSASAAERSHIARLTADGKVDLSFNPRGGADNTVNVITLQADGKSLVGGAFNSIGGSLAGRIARLAADGSVDTSFSTGNGFNRTDGRPAMVHDIVIREDGNILVAGDFTTYKNVPVGGIALLDPAGELKTYTFLNSTNGTSTNAFGSELRVNGAIRSIAIQQTDLNSTNESIIIGGDFTTVTDTRNTNGLSFFRGRVARLDPITGRIDAVVTGSATSLDPGDGANDSVLGVVVQPWDGKIVVVGAFTQFNNNTNLHSIARLNNDKKFVPPTNPGSTPVTIGDITLSAGLLSFTFMGENGVTYVVEGATELASNPANTVWTTVRTVIGSGTNQATQVPVDANKRFFRIRPQ